MNRSRIEWCDHTWNPISGCRHGCTYCYARRMAARFSGDIRLNLMAKGDYSIVPAADGGDGLYVLDALMMNETGNPLAYPFGFAPTLHRYRMDTPGKLKKGNNIFVGSMSDIFGAYIPDEWIKEVFASCRQYPIHNYLCLTKNPGRYVELYLKCLLPEYENMWYGVTVTNYLQAHDAEETIRDMPSNAHVFLSIEPLWDNIYGALETVIGNFTDWVIIGAETGHRKGKVTPEKIWVENIVETCDEAGVPVFMKDSLIPVVGEGGMRRDFPEQLKNQKISPKMRKKIYGICAECNAYMKKSDMITLLARSMRGEQPKQFGFMCKDCFMGFCKKLGLDIPELSGLECSIIVGEGEGNG